MANERVEAARQEFRRAYLQCAHDAEKVVAARQRLIEARQERRSVVSTLQALEDLT